MRSTIEEKSKSPQSRAANSCWHLHTSKSQSYSLFFEGMNLLSKILVAARPSDIAESANDQKQKSKSQAFVAGNG